jgi:hypothetical protein
MAKTPAKIKAPKVRHDFAQNAFGGKTAKAVAGAEMSLTVQAFCVAHSIGQYVTQAIEQIHHSFRTNGTIVAELDMDGENGEKWVSLRAVVSGSQSEVMAARKQYTRWWVANTPWPERHLIRLSLDMA